MTSKLIIKSAYIFVTLFSFNLSSSHIEKRLSEQWMINNLDVYSFKDFADYLVPNENNAYDIKEHFDILTKEGLLVSTGTERSFIDLSLCEKCTGLVGVDINPRTKAYNDFNTLLLKLSKNRKDYLSLRKADYVENSKSLNYQNVLNKIRIRLGKNNNISKKIKKYYFSNIDNFAKIFFSVQPEILKLFLNSNNYSFDKVNYLLNDNLFTKIQHKAKNGSVIFVVNNINNLNFLDNEKISVLDTSNICDYTPLLFENNLKITKEKARVIWTDLYGLKGISYYSYIPTEKSSSEIFEPFIKHIKKDYSLAYSYLDVFMKYSYKQLFYKSKKSKDRYGLDGGVRFKTDNAPRNGSHYHDVKYFLEYLGYLSDKKFLRGDEKTTLLHRSAEQGDWYLLNTIISAFPEFITDDKIVRDEQGNTPLHWAAKGGHTEVVQYLVVKFPELRAIKNNNGDLPSDWALSHGHDELVPML